MCCCSPTLQELQDADVGFIPQESFVFDRRSWTLNPVQAHNHAQVRGQSLEPGGFGSIVRVAGWRCACLVRSASRRRAGRSEQPGVFGREHSRILVLKKGDAGALNEHSPDRVLSALPSLSLMVGSVLVLRLGMFNIS